MGTQHVSIAIVIQFQIYNILCEYVSTRARAHLCERLKDVSMLWYGINNRIIPMEFHFNGINSSIVGREHGHNANA